MDFLQKLRLPLLLIGLAVFFVAQRYFAAADHGAVLTWVGLGLAALSVCLAFIRSSEGRTSAGEARSRRFVALWMVGLLGSMLLYLGYLQALKGAASPETPLQKILLGLWLGTGVLAFFSGLGVELSFAQSGKGPFAEDKRVARSGLSWLLIGLLGLSLFALNYAATKKDIVRDWSYLKTTSASEMTQKMLTSLTEEMEVLIFYPADNEVRPFVSDYFASMAASEPRLKISYYDKDVNPVEAEKYKVARNGQVILSYGEKQERLAVGVDLISARGKLKTLDASFQKAFLALTASKKTVYFTEGHGEFRWSGEQNPVESLRIFEMYLGQQNFRVKHLGVDDGLGQKVPEDAGLVVIVGPKTAFLAEEAAAIQRYTEQGGRLLVFLDPKTVDEAQVVEDSAERPLLAFFESIGIKFHRQLVSNDTNFVSATRSPADHWFLFSNIFTNHPSVAGLSQGDERMALLLYQAGWLEVTPKNGTWVAQETVKSLADSYIDLNQNFIFDAESEKRQTRSLGAVAEYVSTVPGKEAKDAAGRVAVLADATAVSDVLLRNRGNALFMADTVKWLVGQDELVGSSAETEEDIKIQHTRNEEVVWFYGTVLGVPMIVLGIGGFATRRKKRKKVA